MLMKVAKRSKRWVIILAAFLAAVIILVSGGWWLFGPKSVVPAAPKEVKNTPVPNPAPVPVAVTAPIVPDAHIPAVVNGVAPVVYKVSTKEPVVFLGIDDGAYKNQEVIDLLAKNHIKASLYLADLFIRSNPSFFKGVIATGSVVEDHSINHDTNMSTKPYDYQKKEICGMADLDQAYFGHRPIFFRPPGGAYTLATQQAAAACGMKAVVTWVAKANGGAMQYQYGHELHAGDVVLMHFRPEFKQDLQAFIDAETAAGLHTELLEDWL